MAIDWNIGLRTLQALGEQGLQDQQMLANLQATAERRKREESRARIGQQVRSGDYTGASQAALSSGDFEMAQKITSLQEADRKRLAGEARAYAGMATRLRGLPVDQRERTFAQLAPFMQRMGFAHHELANLDLSDQGLDGYIQLGRDILDHSNADDEPSVIRQLRAIGIDPQSEQGRDLVTRSIAAPRFIQRQDGSYMVVGGGPGASGSSAQSAARGPAPGTVEDGWRFRGGNPAEQSSWEQVGGAPLQGGATFR